MPQARADTIDSLRQFRYALLGSELIVIQYQIHASRCCQ